MYVWVVVVGVGGSVAILLWEADMSLYSSTKILMTRSVMAAF